VQILVVVAIIVMKTHKPEVSNGYEGMAFGFVLVGPKRGLNWLWFDAFTTRWYAQKGKGLIFPYFRWMQMMATFKRIRYGLRLVKMSYLFILTRISGRLIAPRWVARASFGLRVARDNYGMSVTLRSSWIPWKNGPFFWAFDNERRLRENLIGRRGDFLSTHISTKSVRKPQQVLKLRRLSVNGRKWFREVGKLFG